MIDFSTFRHMVIPEGEVLTITDGAGREIWRRRYVDRVPQSIDSAGNIYNGTGYKIKTRLSGSSGSEKAVDTCSVTGFIPVKAGDVIRMRYDGPYNPFLWEKDNNGGSGSSFVYYDSSFGWLGANALNGNYGICKASDKPTGVLADGGIVTGVVPDNAKIAYMRISTGIAGSSYNATTGTTTKYSQSLEPLVVTKNEELD